MRGARKAAGVFGGIALILLGIVLLVLPGPGMLCILLGVAVIGEGLGLKTMGKLKAKIEELKRKEGYVQGEE